MKKINHLLKSEDAYGNKKRFDFLSDYIRKNKKIKNVLEIGCGTGNGLLFPLALSFKNISFKGEDQDEKSINYANNLNLYRNLYFQLSSIEIDLKKYDLIIISEVLEHVFDPQDLIITIKKRLSKNGIIFITVPNGLGPFEITSTFKIILDRLKLTNKIIRIKRLIFPSSNKDFVNNKIETIDTLADSPHINFFSYRQINELIISSGLEILFKKNRTFLCGIPLDILVNKFKLSKLNALIADFLPHFLVSDWMFLVKQSSNKDFKYKNKINLWTKFRRFLINFK